ncbi:MAG: ImmA/IrrE family metallo-endopeptidase [Fibrobacter sp.]|jgi:Zn-dependent peptidase ImmA (M78 family)|nr:ImmA/IrrE family metallo-endopeptidase [Fibrobacter sp.]
MVKAPVNPDVMRWARESANLTIDEVTIKIKKSSEIIEAWEKGIDSPSYAQLEKLAYDVYKRPVAVFFFPHPPKEDDTKKSFRTIPETEFNRLPFTLIRQIRKARVKQENLYELCDGLNPSIRQLINDLKGAVGTDLKESAAVVREYLDISLSIQKSWDSIETALEIWRDAFEDSGVFVFKEAFRNDEFSGFCLYDKAFPLIIINNTMPKTRQIFTLFHELGHLLYETSGIDKLNDDFVNMLPEQERFIEILCNKLAAEILVPSDDFDLSARSMTIDEASITRLATVYKVSREVILRKFLDKGTVSLSTYKKLTAKWIEEARKKKLENKNGGDYYNTQISYLGDKYLEIAFNAYYRKVINDIQLADYLNVKIDNLNSLELSLHRRWSR